jgi:hypothetical protein
VNGEVASTAEAASPSPLSNFLCFVLARILLLLYRLDLSFGDHPLGGLGGFGLVGL